MAVNNSLARQQQKQTFSAFLTSDAIKNRVNQIVGSKDGPRFISSLVSAVSVNPTLAQCDHSSILSAALLGEALKLSPSPQLGQYYMVPFEDKERGKIAVFVLGYKGYIQLAIRSGYYKKINVLAIHEGEMNKYDPLEEVIDVALIEDEEKREGTPVIGYYAMFEYHNGFRKTMYWSRKKMEAHALKYSKGYANDLKKGTSWTFWSKDFDGMAYKTMLRQLISKWGIMSIEMQRAYESDSAIVAENGAVLYVDNDTGEVLSEVPAESAVTAPERGDQPGHTASAEASFFDEAQS